MFTATETALQAHLAGILGAEPVLGTFDQPDLSEGAGVVVAHQVEWLGAVVVAQTRKQSVQLGNRWAYHVYVATSRADPAAAATATAALQGALRRLISFQHPRLVFPEIKDVPTPAWEGPGVRLSVYFTLGSTEQVTEN